MEGNSTQEIRAHLITTNEEFRRLVEEHANYARQLDALTAKSHPTDQEQIEEVRLKKLKLRLKDQMEALISRYRTQAVA